jgi:hypothetical protein
VKPSTTVRGLLVLIAAVVVPLLMTSCGGSSDSPAARTALAVRAAPRGARELACRSRVSAPVTTCVFDLRRAASPTAGLVGYTLVKDRYRVSRDRGAGVFYGHKKAFDVLVRIGSHSRLASHRYTASEGTTLVTVEITSNS